MPYRGTTMSDPVAACNRLDVDVETSPEPRPPMRDAVGPHESA
jgi:hypothetical protein